MVIIIKQRNLNVSQRAKWEELPLEKTKWKIVSALNSNNHYKRPKETHSAAPPDNHTDPILAWGMELFHGTQVLS